MLGHLVVVDYCSDGERNLVLAVQWSLLSPRTGLNFEQRLLGGIEQFAPLARSLLGKQRIAADDQALAGIVGRGDLSEAVLIEPANLDHTRRDETGDLWRTQGGDEVETGRRQQTYYAVLRDHT